MINTDILDAVFEDVASGKIENIIIGCINNDNTFNVTWGTKQGCERYLSMLGLIEQMKQDFIKAKDDELSSNP